MRSKRLVEGLGLCSTFRAGPDTCVLQPFEPRAWLAPPMHMVTKLKWVALALVAAFGIWLAFQQGIEPSYNSVSNCAPARALFCVAR